MRRGMMNRMWTGMLSALIIGAGVFEAGPVGLQAKSVNTASKVQLIDAKQEDEIVSSNWNKNFYSQILVTKGSAVIEKDGSQEDFTEEFGGSKKEITTVTSSKKTFSAYLKKNSKDHIYDVTNLDSKTYLVTEPFQTKRLIVEMTGLGKDYQAEDVYENRQDGETILQFKSQKATRKAYRQIVKKYGKESCTIDTVVKAEDIGNSKIYADIRGEIVANGIYFDHGPLTWGAKVMGFDSLKSYIPSTPYGVQQIKVAVLDTGIDVNHPMFAGRIDFSDSYNFIKHNHSISDGFGHGTHVSGIIADSTPSNVKLMVLKIGDNRGRATLLTMKRALKYAIKHKANVINMSMGYVAPNAYKTHYLDYQIKKAVRKKIPVCVAAGNNGVSVKYCYPACNKNVFAVSALDQAMKLAYYSNRGKAIDFTAPGSGILSSFPHSQYMTMNGTSMATPHITAAAAYVKMRNPRLSVRQVKRVLRRYSVRIGNGKKTNYGYGMPVVSNYFFSPPQVTVKIAAPEIRKIANSKRGVSLKWTKVGGASTYLVYRRKAGSSKYKKIAKVTKQKRSYVDKGAKQGRTYVYAVKAVGKSTSSLSKGAVISYQKSVKNIKARAHGKRKVSIRWKRRKGIHGYEIQYSARKNFQGSSTRLIKQKKASAVIRIAGAKKYYFRTRTYKVVAGTVSYSPWSKRVRAK